jgi:polyisoprenoid-binding protein YceI
MKIISSVCISMLMSLMAWAQESVLPAYRIDIGHSKVEINVSRGGLFKALGHDHLIAAKIISGTVQCDAGKVRDSSVALSIDAASLVVLDPQSSEKDRGEVQATMDGPAVLNVTTFPRITFRSTRLSDPVQSGDALQANLTGRLNLHGIEKEIAFPVRIHFQKNLLHATGVATILQTDFGMIPIKAVGGTVRVKDQLKISFDILAEKTSF